MKSIVVIGGGIVGAACALRLQAAGVQTTLIDPGDARRGASYGNAGHIGAEQVSPWSAWGNVLRAPRSSFGVGGPLDFRWSDVGLWTPWTMRFLRACDPAQFARGRDALTALLADALPAWHRLWTTCCRRAGATHRTRACAVGHRSARSSSCGTARPEHNPRPALCVAHA